MKPHHALLWAVAGLLCAESARAELANATRSFAGTEPAGELSWNVHGKDERTAVRNTAAWPFRAIGMFGNGCTGTLVGPRHVLTAAHCVFDQKTGTWESRLDFSPGQNGSEKPYGTYAWETAVAPSGYTVNHLNEYDYALVILKERAGDRLGWLGFGYSDSLEAGQIVNFIGYPEDKARGTAWLSTCPLISVSRDWYLYGCDSAGGMSGSGVYVYWSESAERTIYGVHTHGGDTANWANRIHRDKFLTLKRWRDDYP